MLIGLTYDLRNEYLASGFGEEETAEFDRPETIAAIEAALQELGHRTERIGNAKQLLKRLARGRRWDLVFNIAEGLHGISREAQVPTLLDLYDIPYTFSDPLVLCLALHKGLTKVLLRAAGIPTPAFAIVEQAEDIRQIKLPFPLFVKPVAEGTSKGISAASKVTDRRSLSAICRSQLQRFHQPVLVECFLPGREFTVGITGTGREAEVLGTMEILLLPQAEAEVYSYHNKENYKELVRYRRVRPEEEPLIGRVEEIALQAWRALGCRDGGRVDIRCDALGEPNFMELNPLPGLHPENSDLPIICGFVGISYVELIERVLRSACKRLPAKASATATV